MECRRSRLRTPCYMTDFPEFDKPAAQQGCVYGGSDLVTMGL